MQAGEHLTDEQCSAFIDAQLAPQEATLADAHLSTCLECQSRVERLGDLTALLSRLPELELPRDFRLATVPRARLVAVAHPPNLIRLQKWYAAARVGATSLAAAFVLVSMGALYVDSRTPTTTASLASAQSQARAGAANAAPSTALRSTAPGSPVATAVQPTVGPAQPAGAAQVGAQAQAAAPARSQPPAAPRAVPADAADQQAATTGVQPLPTQVPTPLPQPGAGRSAAVAAAQPAPVRGDETNPLRAVAMVVGVLAACSVLATLVLRRRLRAASHLASA